MAELSANALRVLEARYLRRDPTGRVIETPDELVSRVARAVAHAELLLGTAREAERWEEVFRTLLTSLDFLPNSPTLMNAGTPLGQLGACFVLPVDDSMEGIFGALRAMALVQRAGGGTGFSFSRTINLPAESGPDEIARLYREAWQLGLKGVTVYRYGSREGQVLTLGAGEEPATRDLFAKCDPGACRL